MNSFYRCLGLIYFFAFSSLFAQWPGLYGANGLLPIDLFLARVRPEAMPATEAISLWMRFPSLLLFCEDIGVSADAASEALLQLGMVLSALAAWSWYRSWVVFASLWLLYLSFVLVGQSFMSFQWDILLLEVGFLGAVSLTPPLQQHAGPAVIKLLFRFMFWKLMFMAGVVKLYANCPTWLNLTALEYHFATQPLPHGMSWYAHQMHPFLLRAGVAVTLLIEIPLTFFCVSQFQLVRQVGVIAQALLQIMIIFTGNYNFFNLLTLTLMIPVWSQDEVHLSPKGVVGGAYSWRYAGVLAFLVNIIAMMGALMFQATLLPIEARAGVVPQMFTHSALNRIKIDLSPNVAKYLPKCVSFSALVTIGAVLARGVVLIVRSASSCPRDLTPNLRRVMMWVYRVGHAIFLFAFMLSYLWVSHQPLAQINALTLAAVLPLPQATTLTIDGALSNIRPFYIASGYGLFRMMTGVGIGPSASVGIGGVPPPVVARPEIVLEGLDPRDMMWKTIEFRYKPSGVSRRPPWATPHQPRLDWQMWFAALGSYQREPWLVNLVDKLLVGGDSAADVIRLLDTDQYPFKLHPPRLIRATLYHYDFTRYNNTWVQLKGIDAKQHILNSTSEIADQPWWTRSEVGVYLPSLEADNPSVVDFLHGAGLKVRHQQTRSSTYEDCLHIMPTLDLLFINKMKPLICGSLLIRAMYNNITGA